jgi:hypothetical protein
LERDLFIRQLSMEQPHHGSGDDDLVAALLRLAHRQINGGIPRIAG